MSELKKWIAAILAAAVTVSLVLVLSGCGRKNDGAVSEKPDTVSEKVSEAVTDLSEKVSEAVTDLSEKLSEIAPKAENGTIPDTTVTDTQA